MSALEPASNEDPALAGGGEGDGGDARFEPPPEVVVVGGELTLSATGQAAGDRLLEGLAIGAAFAFAAAAMPYALHLPLVALGSILVATALAWWALLRAREPASARVSWDAWGITEDAAGDRVAIAWSSARAIVVRAAEHVIVQVSDPDGRTITCATGRDLPGSLRTAHRWTSALSMQQLLEAVKSLPRQDRLEVARTLESAPLSPGASVGVALLVLAAALAVPGDAARLAAVIASMVVLAIAVTPALVDLRSTLRRALAMRGARVVRLEGSAGGPVTAIGGSSGRATLRYDGVIRDARIGERREGAWVRWGEVRAGGPYRGRDEVGAAAVETLGERRARRRRAAGAIARVGIVGAAAAVLCWGATARPPRARIEGAGCTGVGPLPMDEPMPGDRVVRHPPPRPPVAPQPIAAEPIAPPAYDDASRAETARAAEERRALDTWRAGGPHYEWTVACDPDRGCRSVPVAVDPVTGVRTPCEGASIAECRRLIGRDAHFGRP